MHGSFEHMGGEAEMPYPPDLAGRLAHIAHAKVLESSKNGRVATIDDIDAAIRQAMLEGDPTRRFIPNREPALFQEVWNKYTDVSKQAVELLIPTENESTGARPRRDGWMAEHEREQDKLADDRAGFTH